MEGVCKNVAMGEQESEINVRRHFEGRLMFARCRELLTRPVQRASISLHSYFTFTLLQPSPPPSPSPFPFPAFHPSLSALYSTLSHVRAVAPKQQQCGLRLRHPPRSQISKRQVLLSLLQSLPPVPSSCHHLRHPHHRPRLCAQLSATVVPSVAAASANNRVRAREFEQGRGGTFPATGAQALR